MIMYLKVSLYCVFSVLFLVTRLLATIPGGFRALNPETVITKEQANARQFLKEFTHNLRKQYEREMGESSILNSTFYIVALETDKSLAIVEIEMNQKSFNSPIETSAEFDSLVINDCILFDTVKRRDEADQFLMFLKNNTGNSLKGYHYFDWYDYSVIMELNQLCRQVAMHEMYANSSQTSIQFSPPSIFTIVSNLLANKRMIVPGTLWCGSGDMAVTYWDLGTIPEIDMCCREHDHCPVRLQPMEEGYGDSNRRMITISMCECDRRLQRCLNNVGTNGDGGLAIGDNHLSPPSEITNQALNQFGRKMSWVFFSLLNMHCLEQHEFVMEMVIADNGTKVMRPIPKFKIQTMQTLQPESGANLETIENLNFI